MPSRGFIVHCIMTHFSHILPAENVLLDLECSSKKRAFEQAGLIFENNCGIARSTVSDNLFARERLGSTGLGHGVAVPHGRIRGLKAPLAAFVRLSEPIPFESPDGEPVKLLIFLLIPDNVTQQHLEILSEIAEMFSDRAFRVAMTEDLDADSLHQRLVSWQPPERSAA
jgi:PTS system nitrogen regulatory IIA component